VRSDNGYRSYTTSLRELRFVKRARETGFNLEECQELLALYRDEHRTSAQVKKLAQEKIVDLRSRIAGLQAMLSALEEVVLLPRGCESPVSHPRRAGERVREGCAIRPCRKGSVGACAEGRLSGSLIAVD
jgi:hypothetical protein